MLKNTFFLFLVVLVSCQAQQSKKYWPKEEFRGVWIATVANIDWPKQADASWDKKKIEFTSLLQFYKRLNFNAVIVQVRTAGDALYPTDLAPWSRFLTGKEGTALDSDEDPLNWMIREAHIWGFEFHAWFNPYRATVSQNTSVLSDDHDYYQHPEWMVAYGSKYYYNPGIPEVKEKFTKIIEEVVTNYHIDGVHFDDYFYPYRVENEVFNDSLTYKKYALAGQNLGDWRRANIDSLVKATYETIQKQKPWVQFGISPFGVWKNNDTDPRGSATRAGQTTYDDLYADPLLWMQNGWLDYIVPQLYWSLKLPVASHKVLANWWVKNVGNTNLYLGNGAYKVYNNSDNRWNKTRELPKQIALGRKLDKVKGNVFFSAKSLIENREKLVHYLQRNLYSKPSFVPSTTGSSKKIETPQITLMEDKDNYVRIHLEYQGNSPLIFANIYSIKKQNTPCSVKNLAAKISLQDKNSFTVGKGLFSKKGVLAITFTDGYRRESEPIIIHLDKTR